MKLRLFIFSTALSCSFSSFGQTYTGNDLLRDMSAGNDVQKAFAMGFVVGASEAIRSVIDAQRMSNEQRKGLLPTYCPPSPGIPRMQMVDIVKKHLIDNPASRHEIAESQVYGAVLQAFPCPIGPR